MCRDVRYHVTAYTENQMAGNSKSHREQLYFFILSGEKKNPERPNYNSIQYFNGNSTVYWRYPIEQ